MPAANRREFLAEVGRGMIVASLGATLAADCGVSPLWADDGSDDALRFGSLEPLVDLLQATPADKLLPVLVEKLRAGLDLKTLTAAASLANARTFGGEHYGGFHTFMALAPAYQMSQELPAAEQPLPILKVLYRNATFMQSTGGRAHEVLHEPAAPAASADVAALRAAINRGDKNEAEKLLAKLAETSIEDALNAALVGVEDNHDVHTAVLPWRAWAALDFTGQEHALTLLRQSVRKCAQQAVPKNDTQAKELARKRAIVPKLIEQHRLLEASSGTRTLSDLELDRLCNQILLANEEQAAGHVAELLAANYEPQQLAEAISAASNQLLLRQVENVPGHYGRRSHGDSMGVHASDTTNAWRNLIRVCRPEHRVAGLLLAAANVANSARWGVGQKALALDGPYPYQAALDGLTIDDDAELRKQLDGAIRENNQLLACALVQRYGDLGHASRPLFDLLLGYAISEDGRLHAEKYYRTVSEEFATMRPTCRWRQLVGLARVTASEYGWSASDQRSGRAPGYEEARRLLQI